MSAQQVNLRGIRNDRRRGRRRASKSRRRSGGDRGAAQRRPCRLAGLPQGRRDVPGRRGHGRLDRDALGGRMRSERQHPAGHPRSQGSGGVSAFFQEKKEGAGFMTSSPWDSEETLDKTYGHLWRRLELNPEKTAECGRRREEAEKLFEELTQAPSDRQRALLRKARFRSLELLDLLLEKSHESQPGDPPRSEDLASWRPGWRHGSERAIRKRRQLFPWPSAWRRTPGAWGAMRMERT